MKLQQIVQEELVSINRCISAEPHPLRPYTTRKILNALDRLRLLRQEGISMEMEKEDFEVLLTDIERKQKASKAKANWKVAKELRETYGERTFPLEIKENVRRLKWSEYHTKFIGALGKDGVFGAKFTEYDFSLYAPLKNTVIGQKGFEWWKKFDQFLKDGYKSYCNIFLPTDGKKKPPIFGPPNTLEVCKQHFATARHWYYYHFGREFIVGKIADDEAATGFGDGKE